MLIFIEFLKDTEDTYSSYPTIVQSLTNISACADLLINAPSDKGKEFFLPEAFNSIDVSSIHAFFSPLYYTITTS